jgi:3'5'-cyclic nucleotide phosphodiesterase
MMTAADLGAVTKPWDVHRHVSQLLAEEFWEQGDIESQVRLCQPYTMEEKDKEMLRRGNEVS